MESNRPSVPGDAIAPAPDFRYVGLEPGPRITPSTWASLVGVSATLGAGLVHELGVRGLVLGALGAGVTALAMKRKKMQLAPFGRPTPMAIVPWGVLIEPDGRDDSAPACSRVLRWAAVKGVHVDMVHGHDGGNTMTLWSVVTVETAHERYAGRAVGAVGIERLLAHLDAYAEEQAHPVALDLDGGTSAGAMLDPVVEPLLAAARSMRGATAARLGLAELGYRGETRGARGVTDETVGTLRSVLRDRAQRSPDPRPLAAVLAAELRVAPLASDLLALVQSPHPVVAAVAKAAAAKMGVVAAKVGAVSELAAFLPERDVNALVAWAG